MNITKDNILYQMVVINRTKFSMQGNVLTNLWYMGDEDVFQGQTALLKVLKRPSNQIIHGKQKQTIEIVCKLIFLLLVIHSIYTQSKETQSTQNGYRQLMLLYQATQMPTFLIISSSVVGFFRKQNLKSFLSLMQKCIILLVTFIC